MLASCSSATDPSVALDISPVTPTENVPLGTTAPAPVAGAAAPAITSADPQGMALANGAPVPQVPAPPATEQLAQDVPFGMASDSQFPLPDQIAYLPSANPAAPAALSASLAAPTTEPATGNPEATVAGAADGVVAAADSADFGPQVAPVPSPRPGAAESAAETAAEPQVAMVDPQDIATPQQALETVAASPDLPTAPPKKKSLLASFFGSSPSAPKPVLEQKPAKPMFAQPQKTFIEQDHTKPIVEVSNVPPKPVVMASLGDNALPGVRQTALFEIKRKSGIDDDSDVDVHEDEDGGSFQLASAAGMARLAPNGLLKQTDAVDVACLKPSLVRVLKTIEQHYGRPIVVTSGYRSPSHNRRARGAKNSLHMFCAAADIQIAGVAKWDLANYARSMQGRGGVGTYCNTESVHVDVGPERDWNWRCRRRK